VVYGHAGPWNPDLDLSSLDGSNGFRLDGVAENNFVGNAVAGAGDVNGDGFDDLIVSALNASPGGSTYVVYGGNFNNAVMHIAPAHGGILAGGDLAETFVGSDGNDVVTGGGGRDSIETGAGNDIIHVAFNPVGGEAYTDVNHNGQYDPGEPYYDRNLNNVHDSQGPESTMFRHVDGGSGFDVLDFDSPGAVDLGNLDGIPATADRGKISNIEAISFDNDFTNDVTLHAADVLDMNPNGHDLGGVASLDNVLRIDGNAGDTLHLASTDHWSAADTATLAGYALYNSGGAHIAVETTMAVTVA